MCPGSIGHSPGGRRVSTASRAAVLTLGLLASAASAASPAQELSAEAARLQVRIAFLDGAAPASPYVAVVAETAPWAEPAREAVLEPGQPQAWELAPGRYRVVAGAPGYTLEYLPVFELEAGGSHTERVDLTRLVPVPGRVTDEQGGPVAGATLSDLRQLVFGFPKRLSPLGESHLRGNFQAVSDGEGRFRVLLHPRAGHYLAVQAESRTPRFFENLRAGAAEAVLREVALPPGASLGVTWHEEAPDPAPYDRLQLVPMEGHLPPGLNLPGVLAIWARAVGAPAGPGEARWSSLPPGRYEVWLKAPPRGGHDLVPLRLGVVDLAAGRSRDLEIALPEPTGAAPALVEDAAALRILTLDLPEHELGSLEVLQWRGDDRAERIFAATAVSGGLLLEVEGGCRSGTLLVLESKARVGSVALGSAAGCPEALRVELFPRADVAVDLSVPPGAELPGMARVAVSPCTPGPGAPVLELAAPVSDKGRLALPVRAACVDVTARVGDFAPLTWRGLELEPGTTRDLGSLRLRPGAAVLARVLSPLDGRPLDGVTVRVVERQQVTELLRAGAAPETGAAAAVTREGGWARLRGLPPGRDLVVLLQGKEGRVPHPAAELVLTPNEERVLDSLELPPPTELTVEVEISRRLQEIDAIPYQVYLRRLDPGLDLSLTRDVEPDGAVRFGEVLAGTWRLEGIARAGDGKPFPAGSAEIELLPGEQRTFVLKLADSLYRGRVTYQGLPVEGSLRVTPIAPADRRGMSVRLDAEGEYRLPLEGPGTYTVQVFDRDDRFRDATLPEVRFEDPDEPADLRVPEGRIAGRVIDAAGEPVPEARVEVRSRQGLEDERFVWARRSRPAEPGGGFALEALTPGAWTVAARAGELQSEPRVVELGPDERVESLEVVLEPAGRVTGTVVDASGRPVAGARLRITPQPGPSLEFVPVVRAETDALGRFELSTTYVERLANLEVIAPEGTAAAVRIRLEPEMVVELPPMGGELRLELPCAARGTWTSGVHFLVDAAGAYLPVPALGSAERSSEAPCRTLRRIPGVGAGLWRVVQVRSAAEDVLLMTGQGRLLQSLAEVASRPGAGLRVTVEPEAFDASVRKNDDRGQR